MIQQSDVSSVVRLGDELCRQDTSGFVYCHISVANRLMATRLACVLLDDTNKGICILYLCFYLVSFFIQLYNKTPLAAIIEVSLNSVYN